MNYVFLTVFEGHSRSSLLPFVPEVSATSLIFSDLTSGRPIVFLLVPHENSFADTCTHLEVFGSTLFLLGSQLRPYLLFIMIISLLV
jgi:hypothetical protein